MVMEIILYSTAFFALIVASYTDLKTREVPDWVSYGLIAAALGLRLLFSLAALDWMILLQGLAGFLIFVALGYIMYYTGQWGGGDSKLMMGLGAVLGLDFGSFPILALFFINVLFAGAVYGVCWLIALAWLHASAAQKEMMKLLKHTRNTRYLFFILTAILIILTLLISRDTVMRLAFLMIAVLPLLSFYIWAAIKAVETVALYKQIEPKQLTEGDWLAQDIIIDGKYIAGKKDLGVTKDQIKQLSALYARKKIKKITLKNGIPFVPSFLLGFLLTIALGNWIYLILY